MANFIIGFIVFLLMALAIKSIIKSRKSGGCGCGCENCHAQCHNLKK